MLTVSAYAAIDDMIGAIYYYNVIPISMGV